MLPIKRIHETLWQRHEAADVRDHVDSYFPQLPNTMSDEYKPDGSEPQQANNEDDAELTSVEAAIRDALRREDRQEDFAERLSYVYAENGRVRIPRSNTYIETDKDRILLHGTDDHVFKDFIEGPLRKLFDAIVGSKDGAWQDANPGRRPGLIPGPAVSLTKLGRMILQVCKSYEPHWGVAFIHHEFHPKVKVMLRAMRSHALHICWLGGPMKGITHDTQLILAVNRVVRFVRRIANSWAFVNALKAHERQEQDNFNSAREFIYHCASDHAKLLILHIDLYFKPYHDVEGADEAVDGFLRWLRSPACKRNLLPSYLGFLVKRENGLIRGMHFHVMVICKGGEQQSAYYLTRQLGEQWAKRTGQGPGSYHNCYADRNKHEFNGLGVLTLDDWQRMAGLRAAIWYMSKQDCVIKATNSKTKNFWRSPIPAKARKKLGRRRADADSLQLLRRMLGGPRSKYPPGIDPKGRN